MSQNFRHIVISTHKSVEMCRAETMCTFSQRKKFVKKCDGQTYRHTDRQSLLEDASRIKNSYCHLHNSSLSKGEALPPNKFWKKPFGFASGDGHTVNRHPWSFANRSAFLFVNANLWISVAVLKNTASPPRPRENVWISLRERRKLELYPVKMYGSVKRRKLERNPVKMYGSV